MKRNHSDSPTDGHEDKKPHISVQKLTDDPSLGKINCHRSLLPEMGVDPTLEQRLTKLEGQFLELEQKLKARDDELMSVRLLNQDLERQLSQANGAILTQAQSVPDAAINSRDSLASLPPQPVEEMEVTSVPSSVNSSVALTLTTATSTNTNTSTSTSTSPTSTSATSTSAITTKTSASSSNLPTSAAPTDTSPHQMSDLHSYCAGKADKISSGLNNLCTVPKHATTLLIGDSLVHCINKADFECGDSLRVRSCGGLCIFAFVRALIKRDRPLGNFTRLILSMGINDILHQKNHCHDDTNQIFRLLNSEIKRVFPKATVFFVLPYKGITKMSLEDKNHLEKLVKLNCKRFKVFSAPNLTNKVSAGGVHPNRQGEKLLKTFYRKLIPVPHQTFSEDSGRRRQGVTYAANTLSQPPPPKVTATQQQRQPPISCAPVHPGVGHSAPPSYAARGPPQDFPGNRQDLAWYIASAVANALHHHEYPSLHAGYPP